MGLFFYNVRDSHDKVEDIISLSQSASILAPSHEFAKTIRDINWDQRRITNHGTYYGDPNYQWLAHIPGKVAALLDLRHPGWDQDERTMRKVLALYPECRTLPEDNSRRN